MGAIGFVLTMAAAAAGLLLARALAPHLIDGIAVYAATGLTAIALAGALVGLVKG